MGKQGVSLLEGGVVVEVVFEDRGHDIDLPTFYVELPQPIDPKAQFAPALSPLFHLYVGDYPHYPARRGLNNDEAFLLQSHPGHQLVVVLKENLGAEEVRVKSPILRKDVEDFPPCLDPVDVSQPVVAAKDVLAVIVLFGRG